MNKIVSTKICTKCGKTYPLTDYYKDKTHSDGLRTQCKDCVKKNHRNYYQRNKTDLIEVQKIYQKRHPDRRKEYLNRPEIKKRTNARQRERYQNPEIKSKLKEERAIYLQKPEVKEKVKEYMHEYYLQHRPEKRDFEGEHNNLKKCRTKVCTNCNQRLDKSNFYKDGSHYDGLNSQCKDCRKTADKIRKKEYNQRPEVKDRHRIQAKELYWRPDVHERVTEYRSTKEYKERMKKYKEDYLKKPENIERHRENGKQWRKNNPERVKNNNKEWKAKNRDSVNASKRKSETKRRRFLGYIELWRNPFPEDINVDFHHVIQGIPFVVPVPAVTHNFVGGCASEDAHWSHNKEWINNLYQLDIESLILDEGGCVLDC